jgi:hypothetical protein
MRLENSLSRYLSLIRGNNSSRPAVFFPQWELRHHPLILRIALPLGWCIFGSKVMRNCNGKQLGYRNRLPAIGAMRLEVDVMGGGRCGGKSA